MEASGVVGIGLFLLTIMLLFLASGVWIAMTLAIVGWIGMALFTDMQPARWGENLFVAMWGSSASWELAALPLFIWMGEILFRTKLSEEMFEGLAPWLNKVPGRCVCWTWEIMSAVARQEMVPCLPKRCVLAISDRRWSACTIPRPHGRLSRPAPAHG